MADYGSRRMGAGGRPANRIKTISDAISVIHNLGTVANRVHQLVMKELIANGEAEDAESFNDELKPIVDWLLNFNPTEKEDDETLSHT